MELSRLAKVMAEKVLYIIEAARRRLSPEDKERHRVALGEGYKDEVCSGCGQVFMAYHHLVRCNEPDCPMKGGPSVLDLLFKE